MINFSFCLCVHNEGQEYLNKLVSIINQFMCINDELIIVDDYSTEESTVNFIETLKKYTSTKIYQHALNDDFATHKNFMLSKATKEYIWLFDADEYIELDNMKKIKDIVNSLSNIDIFYLTRKNIITGLDKEKLKNVNWNFDAEGKHDFPDYQGRIIKNHRNIMFYGKVHEQPYANNMKSYFIPIDYDVPIMHIKTSSRQNSQLELYDKIMNKK